MFGWFKRSAAAAEGVASSAWSEGLTREDVFMLESARERFRAEAIEQARARLRRTGACEVLVFPPRSVTEHDGPVTEGVPDWVCDCWACDDSRRTGWCGVFLYKEHVSDVEFTAAEWTQDPHAPVQLLASRGWEVVGRDGDTVCIVPTADNWEFWDEHLDELAREW